MLWGIRIFQQRGLGTLRTFRGHVPRFNIADDWQQYRLAVFRELPSSDARRSG